MRRIARLAVGALLLAAIGVAALAPTAAADPPFCESFPATLWLNRAGTLVGTPEDDVLVGSQGADVIKGLGGDDLICGEADGETTGGGDVISGGDGGDTMLGGPGDDWVYGDAGPDRVDSFDGAPGNNPLGLIDAGDDHLFGGSGNDISFDFHGKNVAEGGQGSDWIEVSGTALGGSGADVRIIAFNDDLADYADCDCTPYASGGSGGDGEVTVRGSGGIANGGSGNDGLDDFVGGSHGAAEVRGGPANDVLIAYDRGMLLNGGAGYDACYRNGAAGITFISCEVVGDFPP